MKYLRIHNKKKLKPQRQQAYEDAVVVEEISEKAEYLSLNESQIEQAVNIVIENGMKVFKPLLDKLDEAKTQKEQEEGLDNTTKIVIKRAMETFQPMFQKLALAAEQQKTEALPGNVMPQFDFDTYMEQLKMQASQRQKILEEKIALRMMRFNSGRKK